MMQFQIPAGSKPGQIIPVTQPDGQTLQVSIPEGVVPGQMIQVPMVPTPGVQAVAQVPMAQQMDRFGEATIIQQEFAVLELFGCEARNRYRVYPVEKTAMQPGAVQTMYINEESDCLERVCCSTNRTLTLFVHTGINEQAPTMLKLHKPFHLQGCCCCRPTMFISDGADQKLGRVEDPCIWNCMLEQRIYDHTDELKYTVEGGCCQPGLFCPCIWDVEFQISDVTGGPPGKITKIFNGLSELCLQLNRFRVVYPESATEADKSLLLGSAMLIDLEYFEQNKNNNN
jgi:hypothetical protein